jgi:hypothetical protein
MKRIFAITRGLGFLVGLAALAGAANTTMTGKISDSMCGASHAKMIAQHSGWTDRDCTQGCIKGGAKYVFVSSDGKVYNISNQTLSGLSKYAGENAQVTADFSGDTITVSKIAAAK